MSDRLTVIVCTGPTCALMGSDALRGWCRDLAAAGLPIVCGESPCTGNCQESPVVEWNGEYLTEMSPESLTERFIAENLF